jgi:phage repressor protein C with HTH and peptisase S24 domain
MAPRYEQGDIVVCCPEKRWKTGDYCVVITEEGECLVKKVHERDGHLILSSLAPGYDPIMLPKEKIRAVHKIVWKRER